MVCRIRVEVYHDDDACIRVNGESYFEESGSHDFRFNATLLPGSNVVLRSINIRQARGSLLCVTDTTEQHRPELESEAF